MQQKLSKLYRQTQMDSAGSGRQVEISILEMAAGMLRTCLGESGDVGWSRQLDEALRFNQKIWDVFTADWANANCPLETELRQNLMSLGAFVKKQTFAMGAKPSRSGITTLVDLNDNLVSGLRLGEHGSPAPVSANA